MGVSFSIALFKLFLKNECAFWPYHEDGVHAVTASYNDLYLDIRKTFRSLGMSSASLEAQELICAASGKTREQFWLDLPLYAPDFVQTKLDELLKRRMQGEPLAYLVGEWEFYGLSLKITPEVFIPRPDTETLADRAIALMKQAGAGGRILDLCAGSGCIGLAVTSKVPGIRAVLLDASPDSVQLCKENARKNHLSGRVTYLQGDAKVPPASPLGEFDIISCNPPYIKTEDIQTLDSSVRDFEPHMALDGGTDGLDFYRAIAPAWRASLRPGGSLLFEVGFGQAEAVKEILRSSGYQNIQNYTDASGIARVVEGSVSLLDNDKIGG